MSFLVQYHGNVNFEGTFCELNNSNAKETKRKESNMVPSKPNKETTPNFGFFLIFTHTSYKSNFGKKLVYCICRASDVSHAFEIPVIYCT